MSIATNLHGRLRNTSLPASSGMLPLFEAVANSIHSIEDANLSDEEGYINVQIVRDNQMSIDLSDGRKSPGPKAKGDILGIKITDNGIGFNDENMESFLTLDSEHKIDRGGRGVGRLLWLKAYDKISIQSFYEPKQGGPLKKRSFTFDAKQGVSAPLVEDAPNEIRQTIIKLEGFSERYREASPKTAEVIARSIFEHNLWYFIRSGGAPKIQVIDEKEVISLDDIYHEQMVEAASSETLDLKGAIFELIHIKL